MLEKQRLSNQDILSWLNAHYNLQIDTLTFLPLGADTNASVYKAETRDQRSYFVKLKRKYNHEISIAIARLLHENGLPQVIVPIENVHGQFAQSIDDFTLIVYPYIEGQDGFSRDLTNDQWVVLGKTLRQVHELEVPLSIQNRIRREAYSTQWREMVRSVLASMEALSPEDEMAGEFLQFLRQKQSIIHKLIDRAEQLGNKLQTQQTKFVLCHADIHGGNVLIDRNNSIYIVDWDDPMMAPKERDLMFIGGGVGNVWNLPHEEELFYQGYGKTDVNREILSYYRHERIIEDIALYSQELRSALVGNSDKQKILGWLTDMFEPDGVVDMAFQTDSSRTKSST